MKCASTSASATHLLCAGGCIGLFTFVSQHTFSDLPAFGAVVRTCVAGAGLPPRTGRASRLGEGPLRGCLSWSGSGAASADCVQVLVAVAPTEGLEPLALRLHRRHRSADNAARAGVKHEDRVVIPGPGGEAPDGIDRRLHGDTVQVGITGYKVGGNLWRRRGPARARAAVCGGGGGGASAAASAGLQRGGRRLRWAR